MTSAPATTPAGVLAAYAAPALPLAAMYFPVYVFLADFYASGYGLPLAAIGTVFLLARVFDAVTDPLMGVLSDRVATRWGRRRPWLALGCPLVILGAWMLFVPGPEATLGGFAGWLFLLTLGWTVMLTPYFAWGAELSGDYAERGRIAVWRETAGLVGTILAAVLYSLGATPAAGMAMVAALIVLGLPAAVGWCLARVPEPRDYSRTRLSIGSVFGVLTGRAAVRPAARRLLRQRRGERPAVGTVPVLCRPAPRRARPRRPAAHPLLRLGGACRSALAPPDPQLLRSIGSGASR